MSPLLCLSFAASFATEHAAVGALAWALNLVLAKPLDLGVDFGALVPLQLSPLGLKCMCCGYCA